MSKAEYKSLLYRISKRLDEINALEHILFIYEERLEHQTGQDIHNTLSLLRKLEEKSFLGVDYLQELKDILRAVEEWNLHEKVVKFQGTRREYKELLRRVIRVLEELNDFERLMDSVCRVRRIPEERKNDVHDVRSLIQVLEDINFLGIDCLREIFIELNNDELLTELAEFQKRRIEDETHERRKAKAVAVCSSVRTASQRIIGEVGVQCTFRTLSGVVLVVGTGLILRRCSTLEDFVEAFRVATLPAANALRGISEGSLCFTVRAETSLALEELFERYSTGRLQKDLQEFLVTDDIKQLADGEEVVVSVYIDEKEFREAVDDLRNVGQEGRDDIEEKQSRYLNEERIAFVQNYLENTEDTSSLATGTSDDGIGSHSTPSDLTLEEPRVPCLKDLRKETIVELSRRLRFDEVSCTQFYHSFGLENRHPEDVSLEIGNIRNLFPDTPIKLVIDVFRSLHLYDLVELLEKAIQPRTLRPALPLKEIATLLSYSNRPTTFYSKVNIVFVGDGEETFDTIRNFFKKICPGSKISRPKPEFDLSYEQLQRNFELAAERENILLQIRHVEQYEEKGRRLFGRRRDSRTELEKHKDKIDKELLQMNGEFKEEKKKVEDDISSAFDKSWGQERDDKSTLFVTFRVPNSKRDTTTRDFRWRRFMVQGYSWMSYQPDGHSWDPITGIIMEKLTSFPTAPKLVVTPTWNTRPSKELEEIPERLHVEYAGSEIVVRSILEVLSKRWQTLDLISIMKEVQRSTSKYGRITKITDNLSAIPRFQPTPEQS